MKVAFIALFFTASVFAQAQSARIASACGPDNVNFKVKLDDKDHPLAQPAQGKALVYFIQDKGIQSFGIGVSVVTQIGLDGSWVGANKNNSTFSVFIEPGEHHVCASLQSAVLGGTVEFAHFTAEPGKVYYFRTLYITGGYLLLNSIDSDEAKYLIASYPLSVSTAKNEKKWIRYSDNK